MKSAWSWANGGQPILVCYIRKYVIIFGGYSRWCPPPNQNIGRMCPRHPRRGWRQWCCTRIPSMFRNVSSSNCAWLCINVCTAYHRSTSPSCVFRLWMLPDAVNYVLLAEDSLNFPRYNVSNYGRRAFCFAGPYVWNSLSEHIRQSTSIAVFKRSLKTFLLQQISHIAH